jgi:hypothetical protein
MKMSRDLGYAAVLTAGFAFTASIAGITTVNAAAADYRFELFGKPSAANGKDVVQVRLVHVPDSKPVSGAVIIQTTADMSPMGMETMTGPAKSIPGDKAGVYSFEVEPGMTGTWALKLAAKVQGETETVHGTVTAYLVK